MMRRPKHMRSGGSSAKQPLERRATTPPAPAPATPDLQVKKQDLQMMVLGRGGVGKSALVVQYICRRFLWEYDPTLEDTYVKRVLVNGRPHQLHIRDTAGECHTKHDHVRREKQIESSDCFLVIFAVTDRLSFVAVREIMATIERCQMGKQRATQLPVVLVGNKTDLGSREVTNKEAVDLAEHYGIPYFETSAASGGEAIRKAFHSAIHAAKERRQAHKLLSRQTSSTSVFDLRLLPSFRGKLSKIIHISV